MPSGSVESSAVAASDPACVVIIDGCLEGREPPREGDGCRSCNDVCEDACDDACNDACDKDANGRCDTCDDVCSVGGHRRSTGPIGTIAWLLLPLAYLRLVTRRRS